MGNRNINNSSTARFLGAGWLTQTTASAATRCRWATSALRSSFCKGKLSCWAGWGCRRHPKTQGRSTLGVLLYSLLAIGHKSVLSIVRRPVGHMSLAGVPVLVSTKDLQCLIRRVSVDRPFGELHKERILSGGNGKTMKMDRMCNHRFSSILQHGYEELMRIKW